MNDSYLVKNDDSRILTCFLEYFPHHVMVHDILYEKQGGKWIQKVGSYPKLRLDVTATHGSASEKRYPTVEVGDH